MKIRLCLLVVLCLLCAPLSFCQDARGLITGIVSDASGAVVAGAKVTAIAADTNVRTTASTNADGNYMLLYLNPGSYTITVERDGFNKLSRPNVDVRVGDEIKLNLQLTVGSHTETVTVTGEAPLLEAQNANVGVTMTNEQISDLPLSDGNPFTLARLVPGAVFTGSPLYARPFDNSDVSALRVNGAEGAINFTLNGAPNTGHQIGHNDPVLAFMPPAEALDEFKMSTSTYSAQSGRSAAASINVSTKSGGNNFHGGVYYQNRNEALAANGFFTKNNGNARPVTRLNHYGAFIGGPVSIPKLYDGHNKTFFFFATDHMSDRFPSGESATVPTMGERGLDANGQPLGYYDFGGMCQAGFDTAGLCKDRTGSGSSAKVAGQIYNPFLTVYQTGSTSNVTRPIFPFNRIPASMVNPIALKMLNFYPLPNKAGDAKGANNFYTQKPRNDWFHSYMGRLDHVLSAKQSIHFNYQQNWRLESRDNPFGLVTNSLLNVTMAPAGNNLYYINHGFQLGDTITMSATTYLDLRLGFNRFHDHRRPQVLGFDPASVGLNANDVAFVQSQVGVEKFMPYFKINGFDSLGNTSSRYMDDISNSYSASAVLSKMVGTHMLAFGYDGRILRENTNSMGDAMGYYEFSESYVQAANSGYSSEQGQGLASFLLGLPNSNKSRIDVNGTSANSHMIHSVYVQDDWKTSSKLTLNLGLRWEYEGPPSERYNRNALGLDLTTPNAYSAAAQAAFASLSGWSNMTFTPKDCGTGVLCPSMTGPFGLNGAVTIPGFRAVGGFPFTDDANRSFYQRYWFNFQPRFGVAYALNQKTVLRGGVGLYTAPLSGGNGNNGSVGYNQPGYSMRTQAAYTTQNNGINLNPANCTAANPNLATDCPANMGTLANPFPTGIKVPIGSSFGLATGWGQDFDITPLDTTLDPPTSKSLAWSFDIQRELPGQTRVTLTYSGRKGWDQERDSTYLNTIPRQYYTTNPWNDGAMQAWNTLLTSTSLKNAANKGTGNPFLNLGSNTSSYYTSSNLSLAQLLRPYPQYGKITTGLYVGANAYHGGSVMVDHRFAKGYQLYFTYTFSKSMEDSGFLNPWDLTPQHTISGNDVPHRVTSTFVGYLPIGRNRALFSNMPRWLDGIIGGWQSGVVYQYQSGMPIDWTTDLSYNGDPTKLKLDLNKDNISHGGGFDSTGKPIPGSVIDVSGFYPTGGSACNMVVGSATKVSTNCQSDPLVNLSSYHVRTFPLRLGNLRNQGQNNWDINVVKKFKITEHVTYQLRADFLNAFNHVWFNKFDKYMVDPTDGNNRFGRIQGQRNLPRNIQVGMKLTF